MLFNLDMILSPVVPTPHVLQAKFRLEAGHFRTGRAEKKRRVVRSVLFSVSWIDQPIEAIRYTAFACYSRGNRTFMVLITGLASVLLHRKVRDAWSAAAPSPEPVGSSVKTSASVTRPNESTATFTVTRPSIRFALAAAR